MNITTYDELAIALSKYEALQQANDDFLSEIAKLPNLDGRSASFEDAFHSDGKNIVSNVFGQEITVTRRCVANKNGNFVSEYSFTVEDGEETICLLCFYRKASDKAFYKDSSLSTQMFSIHDRDNEGNIMRSKFVEVLANALVNSKIFAPRS